MPHITTAMERSVRRGVGDIFFDSLLGRRGITDTVGGVKNTFSSWDNCMAQSYCKWPVIAGIAVVSLIIISILWCIIRCACCGMSCCCTCFRFLKCCDCCGGACDGKKDKSMKHLDDPYSHHAAAGYRPPAPMPVMGGALGGKPEPPQYAQFEVGKNGLAVESKPSGLNEDALPPMPSWEAANKKHITDDEKDAVELGQLDPATGQKLPLMTGGASSIPPSPNHEMSPYGTRPVQGGNGYMGVAVGDPYAQNQNSFGQNGGFRGPASPGPNGAYRGPGSPGPNRAYGTPPPQDSYGPNGNFVGAAAGLGYGGRGYSDNRRGQPQRQFSNGTDRNYPPQPNRQYSNDSARPLVRQYSDQPYNNGPPRGPSRGPTPGQGRGPNRMASPPINDNGFDFGTNGQQPYSRSSPPPQKNSYNRPNQPQHNYDGGYDTYSTSGSTAPPTYPSRSPPPQEPAYPGYKPYQPPPTPQTNSNHSRAPTALRPGGGRIQGWDPVNQ